MTVFDEMDELMRLSAGIGLAAPQVGISKKMILIDVGEGPIRLINPRIIKKRGSHVSEEGCLSLPGISVAVRRAKEVTVTAIDEKAQKVLIHAKDLLARALQHEIDHLRGRLIIDHASLFEKVRLRPQLANLKRGAGGEVS